MKRKLKLLVVVALCALTGSASDLLFPYLPFNPDFPLLATEPLEPWKPPKHFRYHSKEPILYFVESFMEGVSEVKFKEYDDRIRNNAEDYAAYIGRAFTRLTSLSEDMEVMFLVMDFGFSVDDGKGTIDFDPRSYCDLGEKIQENDRIDKACEVAVPVLKAALADLEKIPETWSGSMEFTHETDRPVFFDYADTLVARAAISEMISVLYLMKGYNTVAADGTPRDIDMEALAVAQRWTRAAAEQVNAFVVAQDKRTDFFKDYFFNLRGDMTSYLSENARNLVDVSHWTVRFDLFKLSPFLFLNGNDGEREYNPSFWVTEEEITWTRERRERKKARRETLNDIGTLDVTLRNVFEGKLGAGTFPVFDWGFPQVDATLSDPTFAGTFPGVSRMEIAKFLSALADDRVFDWKEHPVDPDEKIAHYGIFYKLPEDAENNPGNPATFAADLHAAFRLLNPTMAGYSFTGWTPNSGVIPVGTEKTVEFQATFAPLPPKTRSGVILKFR